MRLPALKWERVVVVVWHYSLSNDSTPGRAVEEPSSPVPVGPVCGRPRRRARGPAPRQGGAWLGQVTALATLDRGQAGGEDSRFQDPINRWTEDKTDR